MRTWLLLVALAGCTFPTRPGPPFACAGQPLPTTAPDPIHIRGTVIDPFQNQVVSGAMEIGYIYNKAITDPLTVESDTFHTMTDSGGSFRGSQLTGGVPHTAYVLSRHPDYLDTYAYPALPAASDIGVTFYQFGGPQLGALICTGCPRIGSSICQACCQTCAGPDLTTAHLIVLVVDCNDNAVAGATVTVSGSHSAVTYFGAAGLDADATTTDDSTGAALVTGLSDGLVTIHASLGSTQFQDNTVRVTHGSLTFAEVSP